MRFVTVLALILATSTFATAQSSSSPSNNAAVRSDMLVSTEWLAQHLKDPNVVVLHLADNVLDYKRGHIPGARFLDMKKIATDSSAAPLSTELLSVDQLQKTFSDLGIGDNTRVIIYATNWFPNAARAWFTLDYLGHGERAALLDGGIEQWLTEDRPVSGDTPKFTPATFTPHVHEDDRARLAEVQADVDADTTSSEQLVDARPPRRYTAGHLPGANNIYWQDTLVSEANPVFQSPEKLRAIYAAKGIVSGKKIVTYCEIGMQASHAYFLAKYLGYDAALYDGSFQEWSQKNLPTVKGEAKR